MPDEYTKNWDLISSKFTPNQNILYYDNTWKVDNELKRVCYKKPQEIFPAKNLYDTQYEENTSFSYNFGSTNSFSNNWSILLNDREDYQACIGLEPNEFEVSEYLKHYTKQILVNLIDNEIELNSENPIIKKQLNEGNSLCEFPNNNEKKLDPRQYDWNTLLSDENFENNSATKAEEKVIGQNSSIFLEDSGIEEIQKVFVSPLKKLELEKNLANDNSSFDEKNSKEILKEEKKIYKSNKRENDNNYSTLSTIISHGDKEEKFPHAIKHSRLSSEIEKKDIHSSINIHDHLCNFKSNVNLIDLAKSRKHMQNGERSHIIEALLEGCNHTSSPRLSVIYEDESHDRWMEKLNLELMKESKSVNFYLQGSKPYRKKFIFNLKKILEKCFPQYPGISLSVYGSISSSLALPDSDIDICIEGIPLTGIEDIFDKLAILQIALKGETYLIESTIIKSRKVPLLKLVI